MAHTTIQEDLRPEDVVAAHAIIYTGRKFGSTKLRKLNNKHLSKEEKLSIFLEVFNLASWYVVGKAYLELPLHLRSYISYKHGMASDWRVEEPDTVGPKADFFAGPVKAPAGKKIKFPPPPSMYRHEFRMKALRHSWWFLELSS